MLELWDVKAGGDKFKPRQSNSATYENKKRTGVVAQC